MKVTLIVDSIRQQYEPRVRELLGDEYEVFAPAENCRYVKHSLRGMWDWKADMRGSRVVHWNNGLWDICDILDDGKMFTSLDEYIDNMLRLADVLLKRYDVVIFATTTPVTETNPHNKTSEIKKYTDAVVPELIKRGVIINDLFSIIAEDIDRYISDDNIHLSEEGIELAARAVADSITAVAERLPQSHECDVFDCSNDQSGAPVIMKGYN